MSLPMYRPTTERLARRAALVDRGWRLMIWLAALGQIGIGIGFLYDFFQSRHMPGPPPSMAGRAFVNTNVIAVWIWGGWAFLGGLLMTVRGPLRFFGLTSTVLWFGLWWALLASGVLTVGGPRYSLSVYGLLTSIHLLMWAVEFLSANPWTDKETRDGD